MSLVVGQNSWCTVAEADSYLTERIEAEDWFNLEESGTPGQVSKQSLVVSAFFWLSMSPGLELSPTSTDNNIKNAQIEAVLFLMEHYSALNERRAAIYSGLTDFEMSKRKETLSIRNISIPNHIMGMLREYSIGNDVVLLEGEYDT